MRELRKTRFAMTGPECIMLWGKKKSGGKQTLMPLLNPFQSSNEFQEKRTFTKLQGSED